MKLAGLTWWRGNYGSILQAYALQEALNGFDGIEYEIIDQYGAMVSGASLLNRLKNIGIRKTIRKFRWKFAGASFRTRNRALQNFLDSNIKLSPIRYTSQTITAANSCYDGFICGSDQVWNPDLSDLNDIYWLGFAEVEKAKIAYAPSIGITSADIEQKEKIKANLAGYTAISCREDTGTEMINSIIGENRCETVIDPTMLVDREVWDKICTERSIEQKYIFAYILRGNKEQRILIEKFAKQKGLIVVTLPYLDSDHIVKYDSKFGDYRLYDVSPADLISLIRNAEYVFTDSFHCSVFSILYHRRFFVFPKIGKSQMTRLNDLYEKFGITNRLINPKMTVSDIDSIPEINWNYVDNRLADLRVSSKQYLINALRKVYIND